MMNTTYLISNGGRVITTFLLVLGFVIFSGGAVLADHPDNGGCTDSLIYENHALPDGVDPSTVARPRAGICATPTDGCDSLLVQFTDYSEGYIDTWLWQFGDGAATDEESPGHLYTTPGVYTVTLTVTGPGGSDTKTRANLVTVRTTPTAEFSSSVQEGCSPLTVAFFDESSGNPTWWRWEFGDGERSYQQNPTHTYANPGTYSVTLKADNDCGHDIITKEVYIAVLPGPTAAFTSNVTEACYGAEISFTDQSMDADSWFWEFGDGTTSTEQHPVHAYASEGLYTVSLTVTNDCGEDTATKTEYVTVIGNPTAEFSSSTQTGCVPATVTFYDESTGGVTWWRWDFGDGERSYQQNPTHTYANPGTYNVTLKVVGSCGEDAITKEVYITVVSTPTAVFSYELTETCDGATAVFTDASTYATSWSWDFGDGVTSTETNPTHMYMAPGAYPVVLTVSNDCGSASHSEIVTVTVAPHATAAFTADVTNICEGGSVQFADLSTNATSRLWQFGDGTTSTETNPVHGYSMAGTFTVTLTVSNECGETSETKAEYITVNPQPLVAFVSDTRQSCVGGAVIFTDQSQHAESWYWLFGDGSYSTDQNPVHSYSVAGQYPVTLRVANACGEDFAEGTYYIDVLGTPLADFSSISTQVCAGGVIQFADRSEHATSWLWDFGDGAISTEQNPSHQYLVAGEYSVTLTVENICDQDVESRQSYITVHPYPVAAFEPSQSEGCVGEWTTFVDQSLHADTWLWNFGDGHTSDEQHGRHIYAQPGMYNVTLTVSNACGQDTDVQNSVVTIYTEPVAYFTQSISEGCEAATVSVANGSTNGTSWYWTFGDGSTSTLEQPLPYTYAAPGSYEITLTVGNTCGTDVWADTVIIEATPQPVADFTTEDTDVCEGDIVQFIDRSQRAGSWYWTFGDGGISSEQHPMHTYATAGTYDVSLTVTNECGADTAYRAEYVLVSADPVAGFVANQTYGCAGLTVVFTSTSASAITYAWSFGDGGVSFEQHPVHTYASAGVYDVTLTVSNDCGEDTHRKVAYISVDALPVAAFTPEQISGCTGDAIAFVDQSTSAASWAWDFGDGGASTEQHPFHTYAMAGTYTVSLTVSNACGEDNEIKESCIVIADSPVAGFATEMTQVCAGAEVAFTDLSQHAMTWEWNFGDGDTSVEQHPTHSYATAGVYDVTLRVTNACGDDSVTRPAYVTVMPLPTASFDAVNRNACVDAPVLFINHSTMASEFLWQFGDGTSSPELAPEHSYAAVGTYTVTLIAGNACGSDTAVGVAFITAQAVPTADFSYEEGTGCDAGSVTFTNASTDATNWRWDFGDGSTSVLQQPTHVYQHAGTYTVALFVSNDCGVDTVDHAVTVSEPLRPMAAFTADLRELCAGGAVAFTDQSINAGGWHWNFGDGQSSSEQNPLHTYWTGGVYNVTLTVSNECGSDIEVKNQYITVSGAPLADFVAEARAICVGGTAVFQDLSVGATSWHWDFGDGGTSDEQHPSHTYAVPESYTVTLTVSNSCGEDTKTKEYYILVMTGPGADFGTEVQSACVDQTVYFNDWSWDATSWLWDFGDGTTSTETEASHAYAAPGSYTVSLTVSNRCGLDTETKVSYVTIMDGPEAAFAASSIIGPAPLAVTFADQSVSASGIGTWSWSFGDGGASSVQHPTHTFAAKGVYTVVLTVTDQCGEDTATTTITVLDGGEPCDIDFTAEPNSGCESVTVLFQGYTIGECSATGWTWDFGDPASGTSNSALGVSAQHTYSTSGLYTVTLTAVGTTGTLQRIKTDFVTVESAPTAAFTAIPTSGVAPLWVRCEDQSSGVVDGGLRWTFGDPTSGSADTSYEKSPYHMYEAPGAYTVTLIASNECGADTATTIVTVSPVVSLVKEVDKPIVTPGERLEYTVRLRNLAEYPLYYVQVADTVPDSSTFVAGSITAGGIYDGSLDVVNWTVPLLDPGNEAVLTFSVDVNGSFAQLPSTISNQAFATVPEAAKTVTSVHVYPSNIVETIVDQPTGGLTVTKAVSARLALPGDQLTYSITVSNASPAAANDVVVFDAIPEYTGYVNGSISSGGTYLMTTDSLYWSLGTIGAGQSRTVSFAVTIDVSTGDGVNIPNTALANSSLGGDQSNEVVTTVSLTPIVVRKTAGRPSGMIGDLVHFTITVENYSNDIFTDVSLIDTMPAGTYFVAGSSKVDGSRCGDPVGNNPYEWELGDLAAGGSLKLTYTGVIGATVRPGTNENIARAHALQGGARVYSNRAIAPIFIVSSTLAGSIRGKVIVDCNDDGLADFTPAPYGMDVYLDDGSHSQVNQAGMFYFSTVRPGERVVALDERDLDGYVVAEGAQASVFCHVHETGESYVIFRICPDHPRLAIRKQAAVVPTVKITKKAQLNPDQPTDSLGVLVDYVLDIKSNGLVNPTALRVVDSLPRDTRLVLQDNQPLEPVMAGDQLIYEVTAAHERLETSVFYSLRDLTPGVRRFLTNKAHLETVPGADDGAGKRIASVPASVEAGPFLLAPPRDVMVTLTPALFITSKADLLPEAIPQLEAVADSIARYSDATIRVEGHTDYRPIHTPEFPSNWELGAARAEAVVNWLVDNRGIERDRLKFESFAATRPKVTSGTTSSELQPNRRTEVIIEASLSGGFLDPSVRPGMSWENSTSLALDPVRFDTAFERTSEVIETGLDDSWEIVLTVTNTGAIVAGDVDLTDVLPENCEYLLGSATVNGAAAEAAISGSTIAVALGDIAPDQEVEVRYRIRALADRLPSGGGAASIELQIGDKLPVVQTSNDVRFK